jgi:carboxyl-terminal processing protease
LQAARELVDLFISKGVVLHVRGIYDDQMWAHEDGGYLKIPIVVLVNEKSASSSEIVAGALQDYGRALLVGTQTYGKSCIQNIYETKSGLGTDYEGGVKLTTLWYYLPSGRSVRHLNPDIPLASSQLKEVERLQLPYEWPDQISLSAPFASASTKVKNVISKYSSSISQDSSPEEAGRRLLRMMALSQ